MKTGNQWKGVLLLLFILLMFYVLKLLSGPSKSSLFPRRAPFLVELDGDVRRPGVYPFYEKPDIRTLIQAAGGLNNDTDYPGGIEDLRLISGARVTIRNNGKGYKTSLGNMSAFFKITLDIPLSLNRETEEGLTAIPGIGTTLASAIVKERSRRKYFRDVRELMEVQGIGHKLYERIRPYLAL